MKTVLLIISFVLIRYSLTITRTYRLEVSYGTAAPDNYFQRNPLINGKVVGPTIRAKKNDRLLVHVTNRLNHGFSMHWHGLHMKSQNRFDGVAGVTQQAIPPNRTYIYQIDIRQQDGTFIYHAHTRMDHIWVFGLLIIDDSDILAGHPAYKYDEERYIVISQNFHTRGDDLYDIVMRKHFTRLSNGDSILINGRSFGVWDQNYKQYKNRDIGYDVITVEANKVYRFRFVNIGDNTAVNCTIEAHMMTIIESDETIINPLQANHLLLDIAQRYSVLLRTNKKPGNYIIKCHCFPGEGPDNGIAILNYKRAEDPTPLRTIARPGRAPALVGSVDWIDDQIRPSNLLREIAVYPLPKRVDREIFVEIKDVIVDGFLHITINDMHYKEQRINLLSQYRSGVNISRYPLVFSLDFGETVQIVYQNNLFFNNTECLEHPFHTHGHSFYVVGYAEDKYIANEAKLIIDDNIKNNRYQFRDVNSVSRMHVNTNARPCGWTAIRFIANNPGVWLAHCHTTEHMLLGLQYVLVVSEFKCRIDGWFADPVDRNAYYHCVNHRNEIITKKYYCKSSFIYDEQTNNCIKSQI